MTCGFESVPPSVTATAAPAQSRFYSCDKHSSENRAWLKRLSAWFDERIDLNVMFTQVRKLVSGNKKRYNDDGFDLDLSCKLDSLKIFLTYCCIITC